jgi:hypothetical protein
LSSKNLRNRPFRLSPSLVTSSIVRFSPSPYPSGLSISTRFACTLVGERPMNRASASADGNGRPEFSRQERLLLFTKAA